MSRRGAFGTSRRELRERRRNAVSMRRDVRRNGEKLHDRRWIIVVVVIILVLFLLHVI